MEPRVQSGIEKNLLILVYPALMHFLSNLWLIRKTADSISVIKAVVTANFVSLKKLANRTLSVKSWFSESGGTFRKKRKKTTFRKRKRQRP
jgi:hypothetical protein